MRRYRYPFRYWIILIVLITLAVYGFITYSQVDVYTDSNLVSEKPIKNNESYQMIVEPGIRSMGVNILDKMQQVIFLTADQTRGSGISPANGEKGVPLYRPVEFTFDQDISSASVKVTEMPGETVVPGNVEIKRSKVFFRPYYAFLPGNTYRVMLRAELANPERLYEYELYFTTVNMGEKYWVEVKLGEKHTMTVYKGRQQVRHMPASGGRPECPTPMGYFYTKDRGHSFWSQRFGEGATYWVRLAGQYLVHSVPKDSHWETKEEEHKKLGLPASHGCIRLDEKDAQWFFENIPRGTLVIIHP